MADLYTTEGMYHYTYGVNLRAYAAYLAGIAINVVGFAGVARPVPLVATRIYELSFFTGFGVSAVVYIALNYIFPHRQPTAEECDAVTEWSDYRESEDQVSVEEDEKSVGSASPKTLSAKARVDAA